jgi:hypothetical protein
MIRRLIGDWAAIDHFLVKLLLAAAPVLIAAAGAGADWADSRICISPYLPQFPMETADWQPEVPGKTICTLEGRRVRCRAGRLPSTGFDHRFSPNAISCSQSNADGSAAISPGKHGAVPFPQPTQLSAGRASLQPNPAQLALATIHHRHSF